MTAPEPVLRVRDLKKSFGPKSIFDGLNVEVYPGETLVVLGGSGTGKSVLLKCIVGLMMPEGGSIEAWGQEIVGQDRAEWTELRKRIGFVFQGAALFDSMSVFGNMSYPLHTHGWRDQEKIAARVAECLELVGMPGIEARMPEELSGGMRKRVGLARAIAISPEVILYDEPTTGLDPSNVQRINRLIRKLQAELKVTSIVVTHDMASAFEVGDRFALLWDRRILWCGTVDEARTSTDPLVRGFIEGTLEEI